MQTASWATLLITAIVVCGDARARAEGCTDGKARDSGRCITAHAKPRGTHFLAEVHGGSTTYGSGGLALSAAFGVGGKLRGFPPRFYLLTEVGTSGSTTTGAVAGAGVTYRDERRFYDFAGGLRIYLPIWGPIRLFAEGLIGASYLSANLARAGQPTLSAAGWAALFQAGAGLQVRLLRHLSAGGRFKMMFGDDDGVGGFREIVGADAPLRSMATVSLSYHF